MRRQLSISLQWILAVAGSLALEGAALPTRSLAAVYTVGGTHPTLQAAVNAARAQPGTHEIRLNADPVREPVRVELAAGRTLTISGGWDKSFKVLEPGASTDIHADNQHRPLTVKLDGGKLTLRRLNIRSGRSGSERVGGGLWAWIRDGRLEIQDSTWMNNVAFEEGGGAWVYLDGGAELLLTRLTFDNNMARGSLVFGGGLAIVDRPGARGNSATVQSCRFQENGISSDGFTGNAGGGLFANLENTTLRVLDTSFTGNQRYRAGPPSLGTGLALWAAGTARIEARRLWVAGQRVRSQGFADGQVDLRTSGRAVIAFTDSAVVQSFMRGVVARATERSSLRLVNLTIAFNDRGGLEIENLEPGADDTEAFASVDNTILWNNDGAPRIGGLVMRRHNLVNIDPLFRPTTFRLLPKSRALDAGSRAVGVGPLDLARRARVAGKDVDIGAYELP